MSKEPIKKYISSSKQWQWSYELARRIDMSDWSPDIVIGLYRGGVYTSIIIEDYLRSKHKSSIHFPLVCKSYSEDVVGIEPGECIVKLSAENETDILATFKKVKRPLNVLIVDDICDTGKTLTAVKKTLDAFALRAVDGTILTVDTDIMSFKYRTACLYWKPNKSDVMPTWWIKEVENDDWIVFPHEFCDVDIKVKLYHEKKE